MIVNAPSWFSFLWKSAYPICNLPCMHVLSTLGGFVSLLITGCFIALTFNHTYITPNHFPLLPVIKPMVNERTQKKVKIVSGGRETLEAMKEFVDPANIPKRYGGELSYGEEIDCRWSSPEEVTLREHVDAVNKKLGVEYKMG